ncbi:MAG: hypothetical protein IJZ19_02555 [Lentisphaeria bacterium]|nr:hypothetical protein [Lentisphaeria bacterium]
MLYLKKMLVAVVCFMISAVMAADPVIIFNPMQIESKLIDASLFNDLVAAELSCTAGIKLVERNQLDRILKEKSLSPNGMLDANAINNIGSLLGADCFVSGSVREKDNKLLIFVKSIYVKNSVMKMKYISIAADLEKAAKATAQVAVDTVKMQKTQKLSIVSPGGQLLFPDRKRPIVAVCIPEIHIASQRLIDPAAENELTKILLQQKFNVKQMSSTLAIGKNGLIESIIGDRTTMLKIARKSGADYLIYGEAVSESSDTFGNYRTSRARVELKIIATASNNVIWADSAYAGAADTSEIISGKKAIQKAAAALALKVADALLR